MKCPYCSADVKADARKCPSCGGPLDKISPGVAQAESIPEAFPNAEPSPPVKPPEPKPEPSAAAEPQPAVEILQPAAPSAPAFAIPSDRSVLAIASIALGVFSLLFSCVPFCGVPLAIIGLVLGIMGLKTKMRAWSYGGIALNALGILIAVLYIAGIAALVVFGNTQ